MTKNDIVTQIARETGVSRLTAQKVVESFMGTVQESLAKDKNIYLRGFGSFIIKKSRETSKGYCKEYYRNCSGTLYTIFQTV